MRQNNPFKLRLLIISVEQVQQLLSRVEFCYGATTSKHTFHAPVFAFLGNALLQGKAGQLLLLASQLCITVRAQLCLS
jgi:hypothetical protein